MVKKVKIDGKELFQCEACDMNYAEEVWAKKCEDWCNKHHSCNMEITAHRVE